ITPSLFEQFVGTPQEAVDEYTFTQVLGYNEAKRQLHKHWSTWVTEKDIVTLDSYGINHLRIPIGYWAFDKVPSEPFVKGAFEYLLKGVLWAKKYNLKVVLDLHCAPGSQNGFDNSGKQGPVEWQTGATDNIPRTIKAIKIMTERFSSPRFKNTVTAINVLNEPARQVAYHFSLKFKYKIYDSYNVIRHINSDILIIYHTAFLPLNTWQNFLSSSGFDQVVLDTHNYAVFDYSLLAMNQEQRLNFVCLSKADITSNQGIWILVGEWSLAITDCTKWLNGFGHGEGNYLNWTHDYKNYLKNYASAQMDAYETG
ncbi:32339_t:CDS:2, partial [Racocetra persica]